MQSREISRLGREVSVVGLGTWQLGADILNCFRHKPLEEVLPAAREAGVGIIVRVPLASGLLSGRRRPAGQGWP
jgi:aryl-alcohol dehydrogenase-like predicted oxidoreductase